MSREIEFETLDDVSVQQILEDRSVEVVVTNFKGTFNEDGIELDGYTLECEDEIDLCDILNLSFDQPVICERRDVENAISEAEYRTLKVSDDRRGVQLKETEALLESANKKIGVLEGVLDTRREVIVASENAAEKLQQKATGLFKANQDMFKIIKDRDNKLSALRYQLAELNKPWWAKLGVK